MEFASGLIIYGPLGIGVIGLSYALVAKDKELGRQRDACTADTAALNEAHAAKVDALIKEHAAALNAAAAQAAQQLREQNERHERQMAEATQRTFSIMTALADKMSTLADALTRNRR